MIVNAVAPFEGELVWVGTPSSGQTRNGEEWKSVDFVLKYTDMKMQEGHICLNAFGVDKVNRLLNMPLGTTLRVTFQHTAREYNGNWYGKNTAFGISVVTDQTPAQQKEEQKPAPQASAPVYNQNQTVSTSQPQGANDEEDMPF